MRTVHLCLAAFVAFILSTVTAQGADNLYIHFTNGKVLGVESASVKSLKQEGSQYVLTLLGDSVITWPASTITSVDNEAPVYPQFTELKLDDKLNDQIFSDVTATVTADRVTMEVGAIGKYLTPSFKLDKSGAVAYVDGKAQVSGRSRLRFANEVNYVLSFPGHQKLAMVKVSDEVWSDPVSGVTEIPLAEHMLSTNEPAAQGESFENLFDGNYSSIFHSRWESNGADISQPAYIAVALPHSISEFQFWYVGRTSTKYDIFEWLIEASHDGYSWEEVTTLGSQHGLPASNNEGYEFTSPAIALGGSYSHLRFTATSVGHKNYLCLGEFRLYEVTGESSEPELLQPARYAYRTVPMGREVPVVVDWLTDRAWSVPRIDIDIEGNQMVSSKEYYLNANIKIQGNGVWDDFEDVVQIKGRGNTSWTGNPNGKNPYRLKFASSVKPFGMKKGKNWNLIAQRQSGSLLTNAIAMKTARLAGAAAANDVVPVELYMNGQYRGSYIFTQKVGMANNSVDYDDESQAALFELDEYSEAGQFRSNNFNLPVNIKDPEFGEDETLLDYDGIRDEFNRFEKAVYNGDNFERFVDVDMLARYMLVNDLVLNTELGHPKSSFLSRENLNHLSSRYTFGPVWDFDWAYGYEGSGRYCVGGATRDFFDYHYGKPGNRFYNALLRSSEWVQYYYYQRWTEFIDNHLQELIDYVDDYYAFARSSFENNYYYWGDGSSYQYETEVANMKTWLRQRANYIKSSLRAYSSVPYSYGDVNGDELIDDDDRVVLLDLLLGGSDRGLDLQQADADVDGEVSLADFVWVNQLVDDVAASQARSRIRVDEWAPDAEDPDVYEADVDDMTTLVRCDAAPDARAAERAADDRLMLTAAMAAGKWSLDVSLSNAQPYVAFMMDIVLPSGFTVAEKNAVALTSRTEYSHYVTGRLIGGNTYRLIGYASGNAAIADTEGSILTLALTVTTSEGGSYKIEATNVKFIAGNAIEHALADAQTTVTIESEKRAQAIPFEAFSPATYGDSPIALPRVTDAGLTISYTSSNTRVAKVAGNTVTIVGAGKADVTAIQSGSDKVHAATPVTHTLTVAKAPLTISVGDITRDQYDSHIDKFVFTYEGFVAGDDADDLDAFPQVACDVTAASAPGSYPIRLVGGSDDNYEYALKDGVYTITAKQSQTIPFEAFSPATYGDSPITLPSVTDAGLTITYACNNTDVAIINENIVTIVGAGKAQIVALQSGNDKVYAASNITRVLTVAKAPLTITADDITRERYIEVLPPYTLSFEGFVLGDTEADLDELPRIECDADESSPVGIYPIRLSGGDDCNYSYILKDGTLTIVDTSGISPEQFPQGVDIYDIHGRMVRKGATSLEGLKRGIYIINQRKVIVN